MKDFNEFIKLVERAEVLIRDAANIAIGDDNTEEYLAECGYTDYDDDYGFETVFNYLRKQLNKD